MWRRGCLNYGCTADVTAYCKHCADAIMAKALVSFCCAS